VRAGAAAELDRGMGMMQRRIADLAGLGASARFGLRALDAVAESKSMAMCRQL
jgi:hypothetical protein